MQDVISPHDLDGLLRNASAWRVTVELLAQDLERDEASGASFPSAGGTGSEQRASGVRPFLKTRASLDTQAAGRRTASRRPVSSQVDNG